MNEEQTCLVPRDLLVTLRLNTEILKLSTGVATALKLYTQDIEKIDRILEESEDREEEL